jgi:D-glycero-alpha-D-manno-heptose-7-phosphate kinase
MIISKTPVRVSFFGGGTDYPDYYKVHGGAVLSTSINQYIYISVRKMIGIFDVKYRVSYSKLELCNDVEEIQHPVVRECIKYLHIESGLEISIVSDLPARTGIGSSSSFTVGLLHALHAMLGNSVSKHELALQAIHIEQTVLNERVGVQDQLAAAHGGLNHISFSTSNEFNIEPIQLEISKWNLLQNNLMMFYTGVSRFAHQVLEEQIQNIQQNKITTNMDQIKAMVQTGLNILQNEANLNAFGELMHEAWMLKRGLSSAISSDFLDDIYNRATKAGAIGGKLLGAGGGGFFVFYVPDENKQQVLEALKDLHEIPFRFENEGTTIIYNH